MVDSQENLSRRVEIRLDHCDQIVLQQLLQREKNRLFRELVGHSLRSDPSDEFFDREGEVPL